VEMMRPRTHAEKVVKVVTLFETKIQCIKTLGRLARLGPTMSRPRDSGAQKVFLGPKKKPLDRILSKVNSSSNFSQFLSKENSIPGVGVGRKIQTRHRVLPSTEIVDPRSDLGDWRGGRGHGRGD
jgi:hypothetical protein